MNKVSGETPKINTLPPDCLTKARWLLRHHPDVMLLADRGNARL